MAIVKPYRSVPIRECREPLIPVPMGVFALNEPHPYRAAGAPYGGQSPWMLRQSIVESLAAAQADLQRDRPGWRITLFDAYRPNAVQAHMVALEFATQARLTGLDPADPDQKAELNRRVYRLWAIPSDDPATPPPHSTGAAFDCTLLDPHGTPIDMGSPIDENSDRSLPDYFAARDPAAHTNRTYLRDLLAAHGFVRNPTEWWHFSRGDQLAVWAEHGLAPGRHAIYGRADLL